MYQDNKSALGAFVGAKNALEGIKSAEVGLASSVILLGLMGLGLYIRDTNKILTGMAEKHGKSSSEILDAD